MKNSKKVSLGVVLSVCQVIMLGLSYFIAFKIILSRLGEESLGIWTLVASVSSVANVANLGVSASLVKFVASYHKKEDWQSINKMLSTGLVVVAGFMGSFVLILYACGDFLLSIVIAPDKIALAQQLLPFSLIALWLNTISSVYLSVLDGLFLTYIRNLIYIISSIVFCLLTYFMINVFGLVGVAYAQIVQIIFIILLANIALFKNLLFFNSFNITLEKKIFKEIFSYSIKFQGISMLNLLVDPITKLLLAKFGSISEVGYYEMANRLIVQFRQLIVTANQSLIPVISQKSESNKEIQDFYLKVYKVVSFVSMPLMSLLIILSPLISYYWIGHYEPFFIITMFFLGTAYTVNINSSPAYYSFIGVGRLNIVIISHVLLSVANVCFCIIGGMFFEGIGIVIGWTFAIILSSIYQIYSFRKEYDLTTSQVYGKEFMTLVISFSLTLSLSALTILYTKLLYSNLLLLLLFVLIYTILFIIPNRKNSIVDILLDKAVLIFRQH